MTKQALFNDRCETRGLGATYFEVIDSMCPAAVSARCSLCFLAGYKRQRYSVYERTLPERRKDYVLLHLQSAQRSIPSAAIPFATLKRNKYGTNRWRARRGSNRMSLRVSCVWTPHVARRTPNAKRQTPLAVHRIHKWTLDTAT